MDEFDEFLMIMMLEVLVKLSNLIPPAIESYIIRQIRPFTDQKFSTNIKNTCQQKFSAPYHEENVI